MREVWWGDPTNRRHRHTPDNPGHVGLSVANGPLALHAVSPTPFLAGIHGCQKAATPPSGSPPPPLGCVFVPPNKQRHPHLSTKNNRE